MGRCLGSRNLFSVFHPTWLLLPPSTPRNSHTVSPAPLRVLQTSGMWGSSLRPENLLDGLLKMLIQILIPNPQELEVGL